MRVGARRGPRTCQQWSKPNCHGTGIPGPHQGARVVGRDHDHGGNHPGLGHLRRGGLRAARGPASHAGAAPLGGGGPDRHRRRTELRRTGNDVSGGGWAVPLPQTGLRSAVGLPLWVDLAAGDPGGTHRLPRGGVWRLSRGVRAVLLLHARDRVDCAGALDLGAEHRSARGRFRDRGVVGA